MAGNTYFGIVCINGGEIRTHYRATNDKHLPGAVRVFEGPFGLVYQHTELFVLEGPLEVSANPRPKRVNELPSREITDEEHWAAVRRNHPKYWVKQTEGEQHTL